MELAASRSRVRRSLLTDANRAFPDCPTRRMVKPLSFKGDKRPKKRKRAADADRDDGEAGPSRVQKLNNDDDAAADDDSWVSADVATDVVGPVMIVLPTEKPSALACDPNGKVFAMPIENIVDGNPTSAEPHDVRMVWVANKVSGTDNFRFKGHHGRYATCNLELRNSPDAAADMGKHQIPGL